MGATRRRLCFTLHFIQKVLSKNPLRHVSIYFPNLQRDSGAVLGFKCSLTSKTSYFYTFPVRTHCLLVFTLLCIE